MSYGSYAFAALDTDLSFMLRLLTVILLGCLTCWVLYLAGAKASAAWRRRRQAAAFRAEVARGLIEIDRFLARGKHHRSL